MNEVGAGVEINYGLDEQGRFTEGTSSGHPSSWRLAVHACCSEICTLVGTLTWRARRAQGPLSGSTRCASIWWMILIA